MTALVTKHLPLVAGAPDGIKKLRELILELSVRGRLSEHLNSDGMANDLIDQIKEKRAARSSGSPLKEIESPTRDRFPYRIPESWTWTTASAISEEIVDCPHSTPKFLTEGFLCLDTNSIKKGSVLLSRARYVDAVTYKERVVRLVPQPGDIVFAREGSVGESMVIPDDMVCCLGQRVMLFRPCLVLPEYFRLALSEPGAQSRALSLNKGIGAKHVNVADMRNALIPLPPLAEQHRIVAKVDELMALCDKLEADQADAESAHTQLVQAMLESLTQAKDAEDFQENWRRLSDNFHTIFTTESSIDALKQVVLRLGLMGKLTGDLNNDTEACRSITSSFDGNCQPNNINSQEYSDTDGESARRNVYFSFPRYWHAAKMSDVCHIIASGSTPPKVEMSDDNGIPFLKVYNIRNQKIDFNYKSQFVKEAYNYSKLKRSILHPRDVVMNIVGPPLGKVAIIPEDYPAWNCNQAIVVFRFKPQILPEFAYLYLCEGSFLKGIELIGTAGQDNISVSKCRNIAIPVPPILIQEHIVEKINDLMALCDRLKANLTEARQRHSQLATVLVEEATA